jgi:ribonuclease D
MATENLLSPELLRKVSWDPPADITEYLRAVGAREWQIGLVTPVLEGAMLETEPLIVETPAEGESPSDQESEAPQ